MTISPVEEVLVILDEHSCGVSFRSRSHGETGSVEVGIGGVEREVYLAATFFNAAQMSLTSLDNEYRVRCGIGKRDK